MSTKKNKSVEPKVKPTIEESVAKRVQKVKESVLKKEEEKVINKLANNELIKEVIENSIPHFKRTWKPTATRLKSAKESKTLCVVISDVHIGKKVPGYDYVVFGNKLSVLEREISEMIVEKNIPHLVVFLIGDVVDGDKIYAGHQNFISMPVAEQSILGAKDISDVVISWANLCTVQVECIAGNHGRDGRKGEETLRQNWDTVLYEILKVHVKSIPEITVNVHTDWKAFVKVEDLTLMIFHGDEVCNGNPVMHLPTAMVKWGDMWRHEQSFDAAICGHYHLPMLSLDVNGRELFINGSFSPPEDYTEKKIKAKSRPGQVCFVVQGNKIKDRNLIELP